MELLKFEIAQSEIDYVNERASRSLRRNGVARRRRHLVPRQRTSDERLA